MHRDCDSRVFDEHTIFAVTHRTIIVGKYGIGLQIYTEYVLNNSV